MLMEGLSAHYDKIRGEILLGFKVKGDIATALYFRPPCAGGGGGGVGEGRLREKCNLPFFLILHIWWKICSLDNVLVRI